MENQCPICLDEMSFSCVTLECSHKFDLACILKHKDINNGATCPMCRAVSNIFKKVKQDHLKNKLRIIKRHYRRSLLAMRVLIDSEDEQMSADDLQRICSRVIEMYVDIMWEDLEEGDDEEDILPELFANPEPSE